MLTLFIYCIILGHSLACLRNLNVNKGYHFYLSGILSKDFLYIKKAYPTRILKKTHSGYTLNANEENKIFC